MSQEEMRKIIQMQNAFLQLILFSLDY